MQLQKKIKSEQAQNGAASLPCMNARREWNERYGAYIASVHRWCFASLVCAGALIVSVAGNGVQAANEKATVYYVNTEASGRAHEIWRADQSIPGSRTEQIRAALQQRGWSMQPMQRRFLIVPPIRCWQTILRRTILT